MRFSPFRPNATFVGALPSELDPALRASVGTQDRHVTLAEHGHEQPPVRAECHAVRAARAIAPIPAVPVHVAEMLALARHATAVGAVAMDIARDRLRHVEVAARVERDPVRELQAAVEDRRLARARVVANHLAVGRDPHEARLGRIAVQEVADERARVGDVEGPVRTDAEVVRPQERRVADVGEHRLLAAVERDRDDRGRQRLRAPDRAIRSAREAVRDGPCRRSPAACRSRAPARPCRARVRARSRAMSRLRAPAGPRARRDHHTRSRVLLGVGHLRRRRSGLLRARLRARAPDPPGRSRRRAARGRRAPRAGRRRIARLPALRAGAGSRVRRRIPASR